MNNQSPLITFNTEHTASLDLTSHILFPLINDLPEPFELQTHSFKWQNNITKEQ